MKLTPEESFELALQLYRRTSVRKRRKLLRSLLPEEAKRLVAEAERLMREEPRETDRP